MGAQNFNFAPEFPQHGDFQPQISIFGKNVLTEKKFPNRLKSRGESNCPSAPPPALASTPLAVAAAAAGARGKQLKQDNGTTNGSSFLGAFLHVASNFSRPLETRQREREKKTEEKKRRRCRNSLQIRHNSAAHALDCTRQPAHISLV